MRIAVVLTALVVGVNALAAPLTQGTKELAIDGSYDPTTPNGKSVEAEVSFGYFTVDNLEIGISSGYSLSDSLEGWNVGTFAEYHIANDSIFAPFLGVSAKYFSVETTETVTETIAVETTAEPEADQVSDSSVTPEGGESLDVSASTEASEEVVTHKVITENDAVVLEARAGVKCFIARNIAISAAYVWAFSNEDIYFDGDVAESTDQRVEVGMRFYF